MISKTAKVTHTCGHTVEYQFIGAGKEVPALIETLKKRLCKDCRIPLVWTARRDPLTGYNNFDLKRKDTRYVVAQLFGAESFGYTVYVMGRYIGTITTLHQAKIQALKTYESSLITNNGGAKAGTRN